MTETRLSRPVTATDNDFARRAIYAVSMVVRIGPKAPRRRRLYLREMREKKNLTQEQLAERIETTKATISRIETGQRDYTGGFLEAAAKALSCDVRDFFFPPDQPSLDQKLTSAPENVKKQVFTVIEALLKTGSDR